MIVENLADSKAHEDFTQTLCMDRSRTLSLIVGAVKGMLVGIAADLLMNMFCCDIPLGLLGALGGGSGGHFVLWVYCLGCGIVSGGVAGAILGRKVVVSQEIIAIIAAILAGACESLFLSLLPSWGVRIRAPLFRMEDGIDWLPCALLGSFLGLTAALAVVAVRRSFSQESKLNTDPNRIKREDNA